MGQPRMNAVVLVQWEHLCLVRQTAARLQDFVNRFGADADWVKGLLAGRTPEAAAAAIVLQSSLWDSAGPSRRWRGTAGPPRSFAGYHN